MRRLLLIPAAAVLAGAWWLHWGLLRSGPAAETEFVIQPGTAATEVLRSLHRQGLLPSVTAGRLYLVLKGPANAPRFGTYRLPPGCRPVDVLNTVLEGAVQTTTVTVVEGASAKEAVHAMVDRGVGTESDWMQALERADWLAELAPEARSLEGFLFPDTYRFAHGTNAEVAARHMLRRFEQVWQEETPPGLEPWGSVLEVVTLASLVEAESGVAAERPIIAGVFVNRLRRGMLLQCDPTVVFALERRGEWPGRLTRAHWALDDPYNTYRYPGLPPGPINSPGRQALRAALAPQETPFLYFVARPEGGHTFSRTLQEHNRAVARLRQSRR